jgi:hypothetical protein
MEPELGTQNCELRTNVSSYDRPFKTETGDRQPATGNFFSASHNQHRNLHPMPYRINRCSKDQVF